MNEDIIIPIGNELAKFWFHLRAHDRTILSARYGDGKSFFLQRFMEGEKDRYTFLTLFPVNYQVVENRDVFELIKYDLLIQMLFKGVLSPEFKLTNSQALALCLQMNASTLAEGFIKVMSELQLDEEKVKMMAGILTGLKFVRKVKRKIDDISEPERDKQIMQFLKEMGKNPVVGQDVITDIIQRGIAQYKKDNPNKKVVLVIEDLDRMDPAHVFRILNVLSAHVDFCYHLGVVPDESLVGNKFGLDKIILVMHYENVEHIYHHFYGDQADFKGYINKFCSSNYFRFSLEEERANYIYQRIKANVDMGFDIVKLLVKPEDFKEKSTREIINAVENLEPFIEKEIEVKNRINDRVRLHTGILKLIAVLRKLDKSDEEIKERILDAMKQRTANSEGIFKYLGAYLVYFEDSRLDRQVRYRSSSRDANMLEVNDIDGDGIATVSFYVSANDDVKADERIKERLYQVLGLVAK